MGYAKAETINGQLNIDSTEQPNPAEQPRITDENTQNGDDTEGSQDVSLTPQPSPTEDVSQETPVTEEDKDGVSVVGPQPIDYYPASKPLDVGPIIKPSTTYKKINNLNAVSAARTLTAMPAAYVAPAGSLHLNKTASVYGPLADGRQIFKLELTATTESNIINNPVPCDIVMVLDESLSMDENLSTFYKAITSSPNTNNTYYIKVVDNGITTYYQISYQSNRWRYKDGNTWRYVSWSATGDDTSQGSTSSNSPLAKKFYTLETLTKLEALKNSANSFVQAVFNQSPQSRIAVVTFSSDAVNKTGGLIDVKTGGTVNPAITNVINNLDTVMYTHPNEGLGMAADIFHADTSTGRSRVVVMFTDGVPGDSTTFTETGYRYAAAAINQAAVLKGARGVNVTSNVTFNNYQAGTNIDAPRTGSGLGCGATVYTIGVFPSGVSNLVHRYMAWASSDNDSSQTANSSNGFNYYFTADSVDSLDAIFQSIAQETGVVLQNVAFKDYIDPRFNAVTASGSIMNVGDTITVGGVTGTLKSDTNGLYMEWTKARLEPGEIANGKGFSAAFYVAPKTDFIGGNNIPTNISNISAIYIDGTNIGSFPNPLVNVPFKLSLTAIEDYILLGQAVPRDQATAQEDMLDQNILDYSYPAGMLDYTWNPNYSASTKPTATTPYNLTVTATPVNDISFADAAVWTAVTGGYKKNTGEIY